MRRLSPLMAAVATVFAVTSAQAVDIDTFDLPDPGVQINNATVSYSGPPSISTFVSNRTVTHAGSVLASDSYVGGSGNGNPAPGFMSMENSSNGDSTVTVEWTLQNLSGFGGMTFLIDLISDNGIIANAANEIQAFKNGVQFDYQLIGDTPGATLGFAFGSVADGDKFKLVFNGQIAWDMALDRLYIPEPASLALVGLGLLGAGLASRRRKAA